MDKDEVVQLCGRDFTANELALVKETIRLFPGLSRYELTQTICEHLDWVTPNGRYRREACMQLLQKLEDAGEILLPPHKAGRSRGKEKRLPLTGLTQASAPITAKLTDVMPVSLHPVSGEVQLWNEYVERYHPLGYRRPFGAHQRYYIVGKSGEICLGCMLFAASAWALAPRDQWIGWTENDRRQRLNGIVNNTRFLIFPWVVVKYLASKALSMAAKRISEDWQSRYGYQPVLLETFVEAQTHQGTCYQAANWHFLGETVGRGRMDQYKKYPSTPKRIFVYPLVADFRAYLCGERPYLTRVQELDEDE